MGGFDVRGQKANPLFVPDQQAYLQGLLPSFELLVPITSSSGSDNACGRRPCHECASKPSVGLDLSSGDI
jgi:hypothetical protein